MSLTNYPPYDPYSYTAAAPEAYRLSDDDGNTINTLFVSGLPDDVKAREIHNLFRRRPGFISCQLKYTGRGNQVVAFATFENHKSAMASLHSLNGVKFDPQTGQILHIELARSNSRTKKSRSGPYVVIDRRTNNTSTGDAQETSSDDGDSESDLPSGPSNPDSAKKDDIAKSDERVANADNVVAPENQQEQIEKTVNGLQPCSTLFIANLGPSCTDAELEQVLSQYPGFNTLRVRDRGGMPVAFADFEEIEQANAAMIALQDSTLPSSDRGGMHIEYARSKMRNPKGDLSKTTNKGLTTEYPA